MGSHSYIHETPQAMLGWQAQGVGGRLLSPHLLSVTEMCYHTELYVCSGIQISLLMLSRNKPQSHASYCHVWSYSAMPMDWNSSKFMNEKKPSVSWIVLVRDLMKQVINMENGYQRNWACFLSAAMETRLPLMVLALWVGLLLAFLTRIGYTGAP